MNTNKKRIPRAVKEAQPKPTASFPVAVGSMADNMGLRFFVNSGGKSGFQMDLPNGWTASAYLEWGSKYYSVAAWATHDLTTGRTTITPKPDGNDHDGEMVANWFSTVAHKRAAK